MYVFGIYLSIYYVDLWMAQIYPITYIKYGMNSYSHSSSSNHLLYGMGEYLGCKFSVCL